MSSVTAVPALRTWVKVHLTALVVAQLLVLGLGVSSSARVAAAPSSASVPNAATSTPSWTASSSSTSTTVVVTTTAAPTPTTAAAPRPPTTLAPDPDPPTPAPQPPPAPASASPVASPADEQDLFADHNSRRASVGVAPLQHDPCLAAAARRWAAEQAARGAVDHQPDLGGVVRACTAWSAAAENVGSASSAAELAALFWGSSVHRANISSPHYTMVGVGVVVDANGQRWASVLFAG